MGYEEAIERQVRTLRWWCTRDAQTAARVFFHGFQRLGDRPVSIDDVIAAEERTLALGESFFVAPHICDWLATAVTGLPDSALRPEDVPVTRGWVWFARPLPLPTFADQTDVPLRAFSFARCLLRPGAHWNVLPAADVAPANALVTTFYVEQPNGSLWAASMGTWPLRLPQQTAFEVVR